MITLLFTDSKNVRQKVTTNVEDVTMFGPISAHTLSIQSPKKGKIFLAKDIPFAEYALSLTKAGDTGTLDLTPLQEKNIDAAGSTSKPTQFELAKFNQSASAIYLGSLVVVDKSEQNPNVTRDLFVLPKNLKDITGELYTFDGAVNKIASLKVGGHCGGKFTPRDYLDQLTAGLVDGTALGKLFIPTRPILNGWDGKGTKIRPESMFDLQNKGDIATVFPPELYYGQPLLSCTPNSSYDGNKVVVVDTTTGNAGAEWRDAVRRPRTTLLCFAL